MKKYKFEIEIELHSWANYLATDLDGRVYQYELEPIREENYWGKQSKSRMDIVLEFYIDCDHWKDSLIDLSKQKPQDVNPRASVQSSGEDFKLV